LFSKIYFPRIIMAISIQVVNFPKLIVQLVVLVFFVHFYFPTNVGNSVFFTIVSCASSLLLTSLFSFSLGIIACSITTRFRDLALVVNYGFQLLLFCTPVFYFIPSSSTTLSSIVSLNPLTCALQLFRFGFSGINPPEITVVFFMFMFLFVLLFVGLFFFFRTEQSVIDTL